MKCSTSNLAGKMYLANIVLARDDVRKLQLRSNTQFLILIMDELAAECTEIELLNIVDQTSDLQVTALSEMFIKVIPLNKFLPYIVFFGRLIVGNWHPF
jgi:hypothetical protein